MPKNRQQPRFLCYLFISRVPLSSPNVPAAIRDRTQCVLTHHCISPLDTPDDSVDKKYVVLGFATFRRVIAISSLLLKSNNDFVFIPSSLASKLALDILPYSIIPWSKEDFDIEKFVKDCYDTFPFEEVASLSYSFRRHENIL